jgi:hypothetical protein
MTSQDRPLTRRELRERERLLEQQAASASQQADAPAPTFPVSPPPQAAPAFPAAPTPATPAPSAPAPSAQSASSSAPAAPAFAPRAAEASALVEAPSARPAVVPAPTAPETDSDELDAGEPEGDPSPFAPRATPQPWSRQDAALDDDEPTPERTLTRRELRALIDATQLDDDDDDDAIDELDAVSPRAAGGAQQAPARTTTPHEQPTAESAGDPAVPAKPVGHWTSQLDLGEAQPEPFDQLLARGGGGSHGVPTTTSALILPAMPNQGAIGQPLPDGGEILVTGSIDLPRSFGATGMHPSQLDSSDVDRLIDHVEDAGGGGAAPVAASRAISTQGHPRDMIAPPKKEGVNAPLVLAVTAGVLALGVVASLVIGAMVGLF